jgi:tRNA (cmo5U34)-methyltransferase
LPSDNNLDYSEQRRIMDRVKKHFEEEAKEFDSIILKLIPYYQEMVDALVSAIPFGKSSVIKVVDLGCGTGTISKRVKSVFSKAEITCLDVAENMIEMARNKLSGQSNIKYQLGDFNHFHFGEQYDVAISSLSLHHLVRDEDKRTFYRKIYKALTPGGIFYNADNVIASNDYLQDIYMNKWKQFMRKKISEEEIENNWIPRYYVEDRPAKLVDQLIWLKEIGFTDVDVIWKYYNFAVYGGRKGK